MADTAHDSNQPARRPRPQVLAFMQQGHEAAISLLYERDDLKERAAALEHQLQIERRRADLAEHENLQLRESLDKATAERDGYFQDAVVLRSQLMSIGNAVTAAVKAITERQAFTAPAAADPAHVIEERPLPRFIQPRASARHQVNLNDLEAALAQ